MHGGWYAETTHDGTRIGDGAKAGQWKANYHTSRALMNVAMTLEKINESGHDKSRSAKP